MEKRYYDATSIRQAIDAYERRFGMSTAELLEAVEAGRPDLPVTGFHRHTWLSFHRELRDLDDNALASHVARDLLLA